jgi:hypothetical protein
VKIVNSFPPNYSLICAAIPEVAAEDNVVFTYGDTIYNPYGGEIQDHLHLHESIHEEQQKELGADGWWHKYLADKKFRLEQEIEAYQIQYKFVFKTYGRVTATDFLREIAGDLAGAAYGDIIDRKQARKAILKK